MRMVMLAGVGVMVVGVDGKWWKGVVLLAVSIESTTISVCETGAAAATVANRDPCARAAFANCK